MAAEEHTLEQYILGGYAFSNSFLVAEYMYGGKCRVDVWRLLSYEGACTICTCTLKV